MTIARRLTYRPDLTAERVYLTGTETIAELRARGIPESTAHAARHRGYYCPGYCKRAYPQHEGSGGYGELYDPEGFVISQLAQCVRLYRGHLDRATFDDWTQELLAECWYRRHATTHGGNPVGYFMVMIRGKVRQWLKARAKEEERLTYEYDLTTVAA
jgi:hypothetical protein